MTHIMVMLQLLPYGLLQQMCSRAEAMEKVAQLRTIRRQLGWSEEECAHHLGVTYSTLNRWERGESVPKSRVVLKAIEHFIARHSKTSFERG